MALLSVSTLKTKLGISSSDHDTELGQIISAATYLIQAYLGYDPEATSYTDELDATGGDVLALDAPPLPVASVTSVYVDTAVPRAFGSDTLLTADEDYQLRKNGASGRPELVRLNAKWPFRVVREVGRLSGTVQPEPRSVKVTYTVTNTTVLAVATRACMLECLAAWNAGNSSGLGVVTSDSMDGASVTISQVQKAQRRPDSADGFTSPLVAAMLSPYAKIKTGR
jgi:hypothetical protein